MGRYNRCLEGRVSLYCFSDPWRRHLWWVSCIRYLHNYSNFSQRGKMFLLASLLLLGCTSAFAENGNSMGCCKTKRVPGSTPKSGVYFLDEHRDDVPDFCKDGCVYSRESGPQKYCFMLNSAYTPGQCLDSEGVTGPCPEVCIELYQPVCGSDGETYNNECYLQMASCNSSTPISLTNQGECGAGPMEDQKIDWHYGMTPTKLCVIPGTNVIFDWTSGHTLQEVKADSFESVCNDVNFTPGEAGPKTWTAPSVLGVNYFACGVFGHCSSGMKAMVEVKLNCTA